MKRVFTVIALLLCLCGMAFAATPPPAAPASCASLTNRVINPGAGAGRVTLETFVPDPGCWLRDFVHEVNARGFTQLSTNVARVMIIAGLLIGALKSVTSGSVTAGMRAAIMAFCCFAFVGNYGAKQGLGWFAATQLTQAWQTSYIASAGLGQKMLDESVLKNARKLDQKIQEYIQISGSLANIRTDLETINNKTDPTALDQQYNDLVLKSKDAAASGIAGGVINSPLSNYSITYFLMLGLFSVFSAIVLSSGVMVMLLVVLLPILVALLMLGHANALRSAGIIWLSNVLMILILPVSLALLTGVILKVPVQSLDDVLTSNIQLGRQMITHTNDALQQCGGVLYVACKVKEKVFATIDSYAQSLEDAVMGVAQVAFVTIVAFTIGLSQLRRIPAMVAQILGTVGGGESSGVRTNTPTAPNVNVPRGSASSAKAEPAPSAIAPRNNSGGVQQLPRGPQLPSGGISVNPRAVLTRTINAQGTRVLPPPTKKP